MMGHGMTGADAGHAGKTTTTLDLERAWATLTPMQARRLCMAAIAVETAIRNEDRHGNRAGDGVDWSNVQEQAWRVITTIVDEAAPDADGAMPGMSALGIRMCRTCGCTDDNACPGGCAWVSAHGCSACAIGAGE